MLSDGVSNSPLPAGMTVLNDATNACVFLALKVCDALISISVENKLKEIPRIATSVIVSYPQELNEIHDISSLYTVVDANKLMRDNKHLRNNLSFTEELPYGEGVFSQISRDRLQQKINELTHTHENLLSIYTCEPLSLLVGCIDKRLFILDTGNWQFKLYESGSPACCRSLCQRLWNRLAKNGACSSQSQSLAVVE